ncbi:MAG: Transcriptional regulator [Tardiphaga sp.]|uniref:LysR family transcriptional regulator n=1 Tax=Tardiphaga sp. TaxID=1926292 RepID=UPI0026271801|nr:LysR family transcriptional regulator [Tardiphaga sp.]MDB5503085.1 Transcriptional regulator [Tardiphaga sp.]
MDGRLLTGVTVLDAVIESGGFSRAAEALGMSASGVSHAIARLEARLGVRLLDRTTRSVALTDEGRRFYERVRPSLEEIEEAAIDATGASARVRGRLRVNVDPLFSRLVLAGHLGDFLAQYPELALETITREHVGDLVADGIDVAIRFGDPLGASLVSRKLADIQVQTVASPAYLQRHGRPPTPQDLLKHLCIDFRDPLTGRPYDWEFHRKSEILPVRISSRLMLSDAGTMLTECLAGTGICQVLAIAVKQLLADGRLVNLFPDWPDERFSLYALYPSRHHPAAKVRAFIEFVSQTIR